jgi:hypothetical protein
MKLTRIAKGKYSCPSAYIEFCPMLKTWGVILDGDGIPFIEFKTLREVRAYLARPQ